jgi:type 1 glutamine amidotransferase
MNRYKLFLAVICLSLLISNLTAQQRQRGPSQEEIAKMEEAMPSKPVVEPAKPRKLLVFNLCQGYRHSSIPYWDKALQIMAQKTGAFSVVISSDMDVFKADGLKEFDAVCFNNTTGLTLSPQTTPDLCKSLMDFVKGGKGIIGIHAATDNFNQWPEAQEMMGGKFSGHPWTANGTWAIKIDEPNHPLMTPFAGKGFKINDEIYRTEPPLYSRDKQLVLMSLDMGDETTQKKAEKPTDADTGISWVKSWGKGRLFYCSLGHNHDVTWNPAVLEHYLRGIQFAMGDLKVDTKPKPQTDG